LDGNEECATATDAKYRIRIVRYVPNTQYIIKYKVVARHRDGKSTSTQRRVSVRAPASGEWYYPSAAGAKLPTPPWPPGACTLGGTESITYTDVTIEEK
jgi:hypothetical protein